MCHSAGSSDFSRTGAPGTTARRFGTNASRVLSSAWWLVAVCLGASLPAPSFAGVRITADEAIRLAFPDADVQRETVYLTPAETTRVESLAGTKPESAIVSRFIARKGEQLLGHAYLDTHRVRTLSETLLVVLTASGKIRRVETISFFEPEEYLPRAAWYAQFEGHELDDELSLKAKIRPVAGATLTARAVTDAARRILAIDRILAERSKP